MEIANELNKKLKKKVDSILKDSKVDPKILKDFLISVSEDYENYEVAMRNLEETMEKAFEDLYEANHKLRDDDRKHKVLLKKLKDSIKELQFNNENVFEHQFVHDEDLVSVAEVLKEQIRKRKEIEEKQDNLLKELEARNKELREFTYIASHDLRSPLRAIGSLANWIKDDMHDKLDKTNRLNLDLLISRSKRLYDLIDAISRYSSLREDKKNLTHIDSGEILKELVSEFSKEIQSNIEIAENLPSVLFRKKHLKEVVRNLVDNVIKHNQGNNDVQIKIYCQEDDDNWNFFVEDNGIGVDPKYHDKVFSLFQTLHSKDHIETIGMGLPIARKIIELYNGDIGFITHNNKGAILKFTIPKNKKAN